ncbi:glycosyltransferase family 2 protein [Acinetobacter sp. 256-1]|uniref:glycosyltransferase family 2 protein n=1 Tax=Acinetobacter sp. 256-1 TaxID=2746721 RepID=UPI0025784DCE|nr:glycosyltransferase family 2 protein [Acinetobacter sp. 256-1]MDM1756715.1 glycosyltransferase family 2 protein [Acinetobacter sp. 256-1]
MQQSRMKVICVVVTFNRKILLENCLNYLVNQSFEIDDILIVDNASSDGTTEYIKEKFNNIKFLKLNENIGGAGGFYEGMKYASSLGYDWIWLMDDDGYPEKECLVKLLKYSSLNELDAISPVQINIDNHEELAFPVTYRNRKITGEYSQISSVEYIDREANLFNGLLIKSSKLQEIGLPRAKLFIRGDEVEYTKRMKKLNIKFGTLVNAKFFHPSDKSERVSVLFGMWTIRDAHSNFKNYYMFRNRAIAFIEDGNSWLLPLDFIRYSYYYLLVKKLDFKGLIFWCGATLDGIKGKFGRHPKY